MPVGCCAGRIARAERWCRRVRAEGNQPTTLTFDVHERGSVGERTEGCIDRVAKADVGLRICRWFGSREELAVNAPQAGGIDQKATSMLSRREDQIGTDDH